MMKTNFKLCGIFLFVVILSFGFSCFTVIGVGANEEDLSYNRIELNTHLSGSLSDGEVIDRYSFEIPSAGRLSLRFSASDNGSSVERWSISVLNDSNTPLLNASVADGSDYTFPSYGLASGVYSVVVKIERGEAIVPSAYTFFLDFEEDEGWEQEPNNYTSTAEKMVADRAYKGVIMTPDDTDCFLFSYMDQMSEIVFSTAAGVGSSRCWKLNFLCEDGSFFHRTETVAMNATDLKIPFAECGLDIGKTYYVSVSANGFLFSTTPYTLSIHSNHVCQTVLIEGKEPTCKSMGVAEHRHCEGCGKNYDLSGKVLSDIMIPIKAHAWSGWRDAVAATCTKDGTQVRSCSACHETESRTALAKGHAFDTQWTVDVEATCGSDGEKSYHCTRCEARDRITVIPKESAEHDYSEWEEIRGATCAETGLRRRACRVCLGTEEEVLPTASHDYAKTVTEDQVRTCEQEGIFSRHCNDCSVRTDVTVLAPFGHDMKRSAVITEASCAQNGTERYLCTRCDHSEDRTVEKLAHTYDTEWTVDLAATCAREGQKSRHCENCDAKTDVQTLSRTEHQTEAWVSVKAATCTEMGREKSVCRICGNTVYKTVGALGHEYAEDWEIDVMPTCQSVGSESRHCVRCSSRTDVREVLALSHTADLQKYDETQHWFACSCGERLDPQNHRYQIYVLKEATCKRQGMAKYVCLDCAYWYEDVLPYTEHRMGEWSERTPATCTKKGEMVRSCAGCGETEVRYLDKLPHVYSEEWTVDPTPTCARQGTKFHCCTRCGSQKDVTVIPALGHTFGAWYEVSSPTCVEKGLERRICSRCDCEESRFVGAVTGHLFDALYTVDAEATCETAGSKSRHCQNCSERADVTELPATGHSYGDWQETVAPTCMTAG